MKTIKFLFIYIILLCFSATFFFGLERYVDVDLIKKASAPRFTLDGILFTIEAHKDDVVFLRTNIDNWSDDYHYKPNLYNVFYVLVPYNLKIKEVKYKVNINGYWERDPNNEQYVEDMLSTELSIVRLPQSIEDDFAMPLVNKAGKNVYDVDFSYYGPDADEVNFISSLDNWNQYSKPMKKNSEGLWEISLRFASGTYYYYFLVDGEKIIDPMNKNRIHDYEKGFISYFIIRQEAFLQASQMVEE